MKYKLGPLQLADRQADVLYRKINQLSSKYNGLLNIPTTDADFLKALAQAEQLQMPNNYSVVSDRVRRNQTSKLPMKWKKIIVFMKICNFTNSKICSKTLIPIYWIESIFKSSTDNTVFTWVLFTFDRKFQLYVTDL